jgi:hypothetical protein
MENCCSINGDVYLTSSPSKLFDFLDGGGVYLRDKSLLAIK